MDIFSITLTLLFIMDPLGNMHHFMNHVEGLQPARQRIIILRELCLALVAMLFFSFLGEWLINLLSLSLVTVYVTSGVILFLTAIKILFSQEERFPAKHGEEPFLVPLAIPIIAGPALLATIMLFSSTEAAISTMLIAILLAWVITSLLLLNSRLVVKVLGPSGLIACERLMGMVLVLIAVQRMAAGILLFINEYK